MREPASRWDQGVALYLVGRAVRKAPPDLAQRLEEEWLADLMVRRGAFSRIRFGLGCCWATRVIAREFGAAAAAVPAGSPTGGQRLLVACGAEDFFRFSRRTVALVTIVLLHAAVFYAYLSGLTQRIVDTPIKSIDGAVIVKHRPRYERAHLPQPRLTTLTPDSLPPPRIPLRFPVDARTIAVTHDSLPHLPPVPPGTAKPIHRVIGGPGAGFPNTEDYYPAAARRLGEAGAAVVRACVDPTGRLTAAPAIVQSSGTPRLDAGALRLARAGSGHYRPTTENGQPVSSCYEFLIRFRLEDE